MPNDPPSTQAAINIPLIEPGLPKITTRNELIKNLKPNWGLSVLIGASSAPDSPAMPHPTANKLVRTRFLLIPIVSASSGFATTALQRTPRVV